MPVLDWVGCEMSRMSWLASNPGVVPSEIT